MVIILKNHRFTVQLNVNLKRITIKLPKYCNNKKWNEKTMLYLQDCK